MMEEERGEEGDDAAVGLRAEMAAVAERWQQWRKAEKAVQCVAAQALAAADAWRAAEQRCSAAEDAAERAGRRTREACALEERARLGGHPRQGIAARRLENARRAEWHAFEAVDAAMDDEAEASDALDMLEATMEAAEDRADAAREHLRGAEQRAAWLRAVAVVARQREAWRGAAGGAEGAAVPVGVGVTTAGGAGAAVAKAAAQEAAARVQAKLVVEELKEVAQAAAARVRAKFVAEEAAAVGAARRMTPEAEWAAAVRSTWLAALARERSRRRTTAVDPAAAEPVLVEVGLGVPKGPADVAKVVLEERAPSAPFVLAPFVLGVRRTNACRCWSRGSKGSNCVRGGGEDGGSWRQCDPGG